MCVPTLHHIRARNSKRLPRLHLIPTYKALFMSCAQDSLHYLYFHCTTYAQATPCVYLHCTTYVQATPNVYLDCTTYKQGPVYVFRTRLCTLPPLHHIRTRHLICLPLLHHMLCTLHALPATLNSTFVYLHHTRHIIYLPASRVAVCCSVLQCGTSHVYLHHNLTYLIVYLHRTLPCLLALHAPVCSCVALGTLPCLSPWHTTLGIFTCTALYLIYLYHTSLLSSRTAQDTLPCRPISLTRHSTSLSASHSTLSCLHCTRLCLAASHNTPHLAYLSLSQSTLQV